MQYYTADLHFGHVNCIKHDGRPFTSRDEMDRILIENWNSRVTNNDDIYIVGDMIYKSDKSPEWYLKQLKGRKYLIIGNHDKDILNSAEATKYFESIEKMMPVTDRGRQIQVCHFPMIEWNGMFRGSYHIFAHIHNNTNDTYYFMKNREKALNAGCMINNYMPVTFDELIENNKRFREEH